MFEPFLSAYAPDDLSSQGKAPPKSQQEFLSLYAGCTFNKGVYRIHSEADRSSWTSLAKEAFPAFADRISCFASDWLGRQFALDSERMNNGEPLILLMEPGTGEALEVPVGFAQLHNEELVQEADAALASIAFSDWLAKGRPAPTAKQCIGYSKPLFLGGEDNDNNFSAQDMSVYWAICAQLLAKVRDLPEGTPVGNIRIG